MKIKKISLGIAGVIAISMSSISASANIGDCGFDGMMGGYPMMSGAFWNMGLLGLVYLALGALVFSAIFWWMYVVVVKQKKRRR